MVPIGIVTQNRVAYLDITLRSLSATTLPDGISVTIYDDASVGAETLAYYRGTDPVSCPSPWPHSKQWKRAGLNFINALHNPVGIAGKVGVEYLGATGQGVVNASCEALRRLFASHPDVPGVILLQDDVVFKEDWYDQMMSKSSDKSLYGKQGLGLLAGVHLNRRYKQSPHPPVVASGTTAQCLYVSRAAFHSLKDSYLKNRHTKRRQFDDTFVRSIGGAGLWHGVMLPFVCQHIGVRSIVRPKKGWNRGKQGRVGFYVGPPYAMADRVRNFKG